MNKKQFILFTIGLFLFCFNLKAQDTTAIYSWYKDDIHREISIVKVGQRYGIVNDTGGVVLPIMYHAIEFFAPSDSSCMRWQGFLKIKQGSRYALANDLGKGITPIKYEEIFLFEETCEQTHPNTQVIRVKENGRYGLISADGKVIIPSSYEAIDLISDKAGYFFAPAIVRVKKQGKYGCMALYHKQIIPSNFQSIEFLQNLAIQENKKTVYYPMLKVKFKNKYSIKNYQNEVQIPFVYDEIKPYSQKEQLALVRKGKKYGFIDLKGKVKIPINYEYALPFRKEIALVKKGRKYGAINAQKKTVIPFVFDGIEFLRTEEEENEFYAALLVVRKGEKYGIYNAKGKELIAIEYDKLIFDAEKFGFNTLKGEEKSFLSL